MKLVDTNVGKSNDKVKAVGQKRKMIFSKLFFEKVNSEDKDNKITAEKLSDTAKNNFGKAFDFIEKNFIQSN